VAQDPVKGRLGQTPQPVSAVEKHPVSIEHHGMVEPISADALDQGVELVTTAKREEVGDGVDPRLPGHPNATPPAP
jgi:hypothetical protein